MPRQERAERTRAVILDAAAAVFDEHGFAAASLSDILVKAGVTKGALYFHFASKEELAQALIDEQFGVWDTAQGAELGLRTLIELSFRMAESLREDVRVRAGIRLVIEQGTFTSPAPDAYRWWIALCRDCLVAAQQDGDLREGLEPDAVAAFMVASFTGVQTTSQVLAGRADLADRMRDMWQIVLPGLVPPRRSARFKSIVESGAAAISA
ncbi:ScbR family autoregulator-binding transcription factor [Actinokineospora sp. NBRC 105648]|uniref:ScbR family autoregulator-binding transcription factor n=1 Tax=Actinokineospora sp. NBRC 105648 TaxID=3032206 RepID=UPI0024A2406F|nr:ScbR family autoregulator-binding transcription factor [Actinokineospora sp. NBRC 105648]GLZ40010.1 TetR family transcriptional regulator [Actinokineospora sp. NBRC 105648]